MHRKQIKENFKLKKISKLASSKELLLPIKQAQDDKQDHWVPRPSPVLRKDASSKGSIYFFPLVHPRWKMSEKDPSTWQMKSGQSNPGRVGSREGTHGCCVPAPGSPFQRSIQRKNLWRNPNAVFCGSSSPARFMLCILRCPLKSCYNRKNYICAMRMS